MIVSIVVIVLDWNNLGDSRRRTGNTPWTGSHSIIVVVYLIVLVLVFPFYLMAPSSEINNVNKKDKINTVLKGLLKWSKMFKNNELARLIPEVKC